MAVFKCKICGGTLEINSNDSIGICEYCGTKQTLPKLNNESRANLYDRANHFRRNNEYDKAMGIYEKILNEDKTDAEAYWSLVLCRFGIEYVESPSDRKRVPTINRAQYTSIFNDDNYKMALHYADAFQRELYEEEARQINEIQKGILEISQKEEPFDVFICYKETDNNGRRTQDSVLANELYHELTQVGYKVFFSRITLEDKLGIAYEPYIFAALNSSKVMVVLGTRPEYFQAVWVKNEWSRYLALIKNGARKILIPAYRDMSSYDLPDEFSHLQAQDMSKLGFMQDIIRGIQKITQADKISESSVQVVADGGVNKDALLKRAYIFLEDGEFTAAEEYCEKVLDMDPENVQAYLGKLMAQMRVMKKEGLKNCSKPFDENYNYKKVLRYGDAQLVNELKSYDVEVKERIRIQEIEAEERIRLQKLEDSYNKAVRLLNEAKSESEYNDAAAIFKTIIDYKDSKRLMEDCCLRNAEILRKDTIYQKVVSDMKGIYMKASQWRSIVNNLEKIAGWRDADDLLVTARERLRKREEIERKEQIEIYKKEHRCTYCGGEFKGVFKAVCKRCGKAKDY